MTEIDNVQFGLLDPKAVKDFSVAEIDNPNIGEAGGIYDLRLGSTERGVSCTTCGKLRDKCIGHFGHIVLASKCYNPLLIDFCVKVLRSVCVYCSALLNYNDDSHHRKWCPKCGTMQPRISKAGMLLTVTFDKADTRFEERIQYLMPEMAHEILRKISDEDCTRLDLNPLHARPEWSIFTVMPVSPPTMRPINIVNGEKTHDDISIFLVDIIRYNNMLQESYSFEKHMLLQQKIYTMIDNTDETIVPSLLRGRGKKLKSISERIGKKEGRIRLNLMGKRTSFTGRSVATCDSTLDIEEMGLPMKIAMNLTLPEIVTIENMSQMRELVGRGPYVHPGAKFIRHRSLNPVNIERTDQTEIEIEKVIDLSKSHSPLELRLEVGDIVDRHVQDGDIIIVNRQPSLHKLSMLSFKVRVMVAGTIRINTNITEGFNLDFDGDEVNVHLPQSEKALEEMKTRMYVPKNIIYAQKAAPSCWPKLDGIIGIYTLTKKSTMLTKSQYGDMLVSVGKMAKYEPPCILYPKMLWSGKQAFSAVLPKNISYGKYNSDDALIQNGILLVGRLGGKTLGGKSGALLHVIANNISYEAGTEYLNNLQKIADCYLMHNSYSIGFSDLDPPPALKLATRNIIVSTVAETDKIIIQRQLHTLKLLPGATEDETFEDKMTEVLADTIAKFSSKTIELLPNSNRLKELIVSEAKGKPDNAAQMLAGLGQQVIEAKRVELGLCSGRSSFADPIRFDEKTKTYIEDISPVGRGFCTTSFRDGLLPSEFYFHAAASREKLLNTKLKTGETGYMQRRLAKAMEDLKTWDDGTVRDSSGLIVQFRYGDDGMDAQKLEFVDGKLLPLDPGRLLKETKLKGKYLQDIGAIQPKLDQFFGKIKNTSYLDILKKVYTVDAVADIDVDLLLKKTLEKIERAAIKSGEMVGCLAATCIGEPLTQMILKSFHSSGQLQKTISSGVPRVNELISMITTIKTPAMNVEAVKSFDEASKVLQRKMLKDYVKSAVVTIEPIDLGLVKQWFKTADDLERIRKSSNEVLKLKLSFQDDTSVEATENITMQEIIDRIDQDLQGDVVAYGAGHDLHLRLISEMPNKFLSDMDVFENSKKIGKGEKAEKSGKAEKEKAEKSGKAEKEKAEKSGKAEKEKAEKSGKAEKEKAEKSGKAEKEKAEKVAIDQDNYTLLMIIRAQLMDNLIVAGMREVKNIYQDGDKKFVTDGTNLTYTLGMLEVEQANTYSNSITEMFKLYGIEVARRVLYEELKKCFTIVPRHYQLLVDEMTVRGFLMPVMRSGINRVAENAPLYKASFEEMMEVLAGAACHGVQDRCKGVSQHIILGKKVNMGDEFVQSEESRL